MSDDEWIEPVFSGEDEPKVLSMNLIDFISNVDLGPLYSYGLNLQPNPPILSGQVQDILTFLDKTIDGVENVFYRISNREIIRTLFEIYLLIRKSYPDNPLTKIKYHEDEIIFDYFPSTSNTGILAGFSNIIEPNISNQYDDIDISLFLGENATPQQVNEVFEYYRLLEERNASNKGGHVDIAFEVLGLPHADEADEIKSIKKLYKMNPMLYVIAMNNRIYYHVKMSYKILRGIIEREKTRSITKSARHQ